MDKEATLHLFWMSDLVDTEDKFDFSNFPSSPRRESIRMDVAKTRSAR